MNLLGRFLRAERAGRLSSGVGASMLQSSFGRIVRFNSPPADFGHPWLATLRGDAAADFLPGFINHVPAAIEGVPLAGSINPVKPPPVLEWQKLQLNSDGIGYLCAEITCLDAATAEKSSRAAFSIVKVEMVQVADPDTDDGAQGAVLNTSGAARPLSGNRARWPVAMLQRRGDGRVDLFQIVHFDLTHRMALKADGRTPARHFFY